MSEQQATSDDTDTIFEWKEMSLVDVSDVYQDSAGELSPRKLLVVPLKKDSQTENQAQRTELMIVPLVPADSHDTNNEAESNQKFRLVYTRPDSQDTDNEPVINQVFRLPHVSADSLDSSQGVVVLPGGVDLNCDLCPACKWEKKLSCSTCDSDVSADDESTCEVIGSDNFGDDESGGSALFDDSSVSGVSQGDILSIPTYTDSVISLCTSTDYISTSTSPDSGYSAGEGYF